MKTSVIITELAPALIKAQEHIGAAIKGAENPFFHSRYADLSEVISVCKQALLDQGITVLQLIGKNGEDAFLETTILHSSGQYISEAAPIVCVKNNDPQAFGSAVTYQRRYALQAALLIPAEDDDAERAMPAVRESKAIDDSATERQARRERLAAPQSRNFTDSGLPLPKEPITTDDPDWRNVVCTFGKKDGPLRGKTLGQLTESNLRFLYEKFVNSGLRADPKDSGLVAGLKLWKLEQQQLEQPVETEEDEIPF